MSASAPGSSRPLRSRPRIRAGPRAADLDPAAAVDQPGAHAEVCARARAASRSPTRRPAASPRAACAGSGRRRRCRSCPRDERRPQRGALRGVADRRAHGERLRARVAGLAHAACRSTRPCEVTSPADRAARGAWPSATSRADSPQERWKTSSRAPASPASAIARCTASASPSGGQAAASHAGPRPALGRRAPRVQHRDDVVVLGVQHRQAAAGGDRAHRAEDRRVRDAVALVGHVELERGHAAREDRRDLARAAPDRGRAGSGAARSRSPPRRRRRPAARARGPRAAAARRPAARSRRPSSCRRTPRRACRSRTCRRSNVAYGGKVGSVEVHVPVDRARDHVAARSRRARARPSRCRRRPRRSARRRSRRRRRSITARA